MSRLLVRLQPIFNNVARFNPVPGQERADLHQEFSLAVLASLAGYNPERPAEPYFRQVCVLRQRELLRYATREKRRAAIYASPLDGTGEEPSYQMDMAEKLAELDIQQRVQLNGTQDEITVARLTAEGYSRPEITDATGISDWKVREALKSLRRKLGDYQGEARSGSRRAAKATVPAGTGTKG